MIIQASKPGAHNKASGATPCYSTRERVPVLQVVKLGGVACYRAVNVRRCRQCRNLKGVRGAPNAGGVVCSCGNVYTHLVKPVGDWLKIRERRESGGYMRGPNVEKRRRDRAATAERIRRNARKSAW